MKFVCPKCALPLTVLENKSAVCSCGHSYDRSKEGYYNLLLPSAGGTHGDNKEMLMARRRFLNTGAYEPLASLVASALCDNIKTPFSVLDMGCGEGYYTDFVQKHISKLCPESDFSAFDISKDAVRLAAKLNKSISFAVASSYRIPAVDRSFDAVFNIFSPMAREETLRVLKKDGIFIFAAPDREHLWELKCLVYDKPYKNEPKDSSLEGFTLLEEKRLSYHINLDTPEKISDLFSMTPYAYRTSERERERLAKLSSLETKAEFIVFVYKKM